MTRVGALAGVIRHFGGFSLSGAPWGDIAWLARGPCRFDQGGPWQDGWRGLSTLQPGAELCDLGAFLLAEAPLEAWGNRQLGELAGGWGNWDE